MSSVLRTYLFFLMIAAILKYFFEREYFFDILFTPLSFLISIFSYIPKAFFFLFSFLSFLYGVLSYIWMLLLLVINVAYHALLTYAIMRDNRRSNERSVFLFFLHLLSQVLVPLIFNILLLPKPLAINLILPISLALFVDLQESESAT